MRPFHDEALRHRRGPDPGPEPSHGQGVRQRFPLKERVGHVTVPVRLQSPKAPEDGDELLDRIHTLFPQRPVRGESRDGEPEAEGAGLRGRDDELRRLHDDRAVASVPALDRGEHPRAAVLLADHTLDLERAVQFDPRVAQRPRRRQRAAQLPLHVHDSAPEQSPAALRELKGRMPPAPDLPRRDDVDVAVEDQRAALSPSHGSGDAQTLVAVHVGGVGGVAAQPFEVDLPHVRLETDGPHLRGHALLGRCLPVRDALDRDEVGQEREQAFRVHGLRGPALFGRQRAAVARNVPAGTSCVSLLPVARHGLLPCVHARSMSRIGLSGRPAMVVSSARCAMATVPARSRTQTG